MLLEPVSIQIDLTESVAYVQYREIDEDETLSNEHIGDSENLLIERNVNGDIMGIDFLALNDDTLNNAAWFAVQNGLSLRRTLLDFLRTIASEKLTS